MKLRVERMDSFSRLTTDLREQWNRLPYPSPMQSPLWIEWWWEVFGDENELCLLLLFDEKQLVGVAPWYLRRHRFKRNCLRFIGDDIVCSDHNSIHFDEGYRQQVVDSVFKWLVAEMGGIWQTIEFDCIDDTNWIVEAIVRRLGDHGCSTITRPTMGTWSLDLPETWEDYLASLSKNHRKRCRRWTRKYFESDLVAIRRTPMLAAADAWQGLAALNVERREHKGDESAFEDHHFCRFHTSVLPELIAMEAAEIRQVVSEDTVVASEYLLRTNNTLFCYQSGLASVENRDGFGNLSILSLIRDAIGQQIRCIDFLRGDEDYKSHWGAKRHLCVDYKVTAKSISGAAQILVHQTADAIRAAKSAVSSR